MSTLFSSKARKAWVGAVIALLGPLVLLLESDGTITTRAIVTAVVTGVVAGLAVFATPNAVAAVRNHR